MATIAPLDIGDDVILSGTFTVNAALTDPTVASLVVRDPDGGETTVGLNHVSLGLYEGTYSITKSGDHWYRFTGTGAAKAAGESYFNVRKQRVP